MAMAKATPSSASKGDWILSFGFGDDVDSDTDSDNDVPGPGLSSSVVSSTSIAPTRGLSSPHISEDAQLSRELDISKREDPAVFRKNPWSIAKLNAASRPKPDPAVSAQHDAINIAPNKNQIDSTKSQDKTLLASKAPGGKRKPLIPSPLQPQKVSRSLKTADTTKPTRVDISESTSSLKPHNRTVNEIKKPHANKEGHNTALAANSRVSNLVQNSPTSVHQTPPVAYSTQSFPTMEKPPSLGAKAMSPRNPSPLNEQVLAYTYNNSASPYSSPLKKRRLGDRPADTIRLTDPLENARPTVTKNHGAASVYSKPMYGSNKDKEWTTFQNKKSKTSKRADTNQLNHGTFRLPGIPISPLQRTSGQPTVKRTLLTLYELPPAHEYKKPKEQMDS